MNQINQNLMQQNDFLHNVKIWTSDEGEADLMQFVYWSCPKFEKSHLANILYPYDKRFIILSLTVDSLDKVSLHFIDLLYRDWIG